MNDWNPEADEEPALPVVEVFPTKNPNPLL
jgi:hypothetical protein